MSSFVNCQEHSFTSEKTLTPVHKFPVLFSRLTLATVTHYGLI